MVFLCHIDSNHNGEGVKIFLKEDISSKLLTKHHFPSDVEDLFVDLNFRESKCLLFGTYHLFLIELIKLLILTQTMIMFYLQETLMQKMMSLALVVFSINMISIILLRTCFKSSSKPTSIHLFLTTRNAHFRNTVAVCSSLSDFPKLALMVLKTFDKNKPCEIL